MKEKIISLRRTARLAGLCYFMIVLASLYGHVYVPSRILVRGDAGATAKNILDNEFLFRSCILAGLAEATVFLFLALQLYRLFRETDHHLARLMTAMAAAQVPLAFVLATCKFAALMILKGDAPALVAAGQLPDLAMLFLQMNGYGNAVLALFGGLWLFPFGLLVYKSCFIPRLFGIFLLVAGAGYSAAGLLALLFPVYELPRILPFLFFGLGEVPVVLWLLIKGVKDHVSIEVLSGPGALIPSSSLLMREYTK